MTESSQITKLPSSIKKLVQCVEKAAEERKNIERSMRTLKAKGLIYASPHWRDGRYLYMLYPLVNGEPRRREYIGADPERIRAAQQGMERAQQYDMLSQRLNSLDAAVVRAAESVASAVSALQRG
jgi:hypothetical protein